MVFLSTALISVTVIQTETHHIDPIPLRAVPATTVAPVKSSTKPEDPQLFLDYEGEDKLFRQGYEVSKVDATVPWDYPDEHGKLTTHLIDATHVIVKRYGHTIAEFDGVYHPVGNFADFGFFDLLGNKSEQLIISLTISRGGRHLVVSLEPQFRVLFDSADYDVGREEFSIIDIDKDGVHEICLRLVSFYGMEGLQSVGETPLPEIIFKYDAKRMKYLPANHLFAEYALRDLNPETEGEVYQHHRFDVLLDYVYAGKEKEGWASFDKYYPSPDKQVMRSRIKAVLKNDPVYKFIYKNRKR